MDDKDFAHTPVIVGLVADLMFGARIRGAAPDATLVRSAAEVARVAGAGTRLVLVDAHVQGAADAIRDVRQRAPSARVVAFGAHVDTETLRAAREAGADRVMARSAFVRELETLVGEARSDS